MFLVWWHPDQSDENWNTIKQIIQHLGGSYAQFHYNDSIDILLTNVTSLASIPADGFNTGFMMGEEERVWNFLIDDDVNNDEVYFIAEKSQRKFGRHSDVKYRMGIGMTNWLTNSEGYVNRYALWQYDSCINYWYSSLTERRIDKAFKKNDVKSWQRYFDALVHFDAETDPDNFRSVYVNKIRKILDEKPIPAKLEKLWESTKQLR